VRRLTPRPLSEALGALEERLAPDTTLSAVQRVWAEVVGEVVAREAQPVSERAGTVTVSCSASVWAQEIDLMGPVLAERLNERVGAGAVRRLRCVATPPRDRG
jgi:predicted nucleic acid-binding Zn ribbon protein